MATNFYKRSIDDGHGYQILEVTDGCFSGLHTESVHSSSYYTEGSFNPNNYESGKSMPRGFLSEHGFKRITSKRWIENYYNSL